MSYHKKARKENILSSGEIEFASTYGLVSSFEESIFDICSSLSEFDPIALRAYGIKCGIDSSTKKRDPWSYEYKVSDTIYKISCYPTATHKIFFASQYTETPETIALRGLIGNVTPHYYRNMRFNSTSMEITKRITSLEFLYEETEVYGNNPEYYIEGFIPEPDLKVTFDEETGSYKKVLKNGDERLSKTYDLLDPENYPGYMNQDGTPFKGNPAEVFTTYQSFQAARISMAAGLEPFFKVWDEKVAKLRKNYKTKKLR